MAETNPAVPAGHLLGPIVTPPGAHAPYAARPGTSRGRLYPETESPTRSCYSRDRDRIIHSSAFRRMKHKTQVFVQHEGDYYRTRLTHSLEVAQLARSLARTLKADEDLKMAGEPGHQELCDREQAYVLKAIREDIDLSRHMDDAVQSLRICLAADESVRTGRPVKL